MVRKSCVYGVEFLTINVLLHTKSEQKVNVRNRFNLKINSVEQQFRDDGLIQNHS